MPICKKWRKNRCASSLDEAEQHPGYNHQTYAEYAASFRKREIERHRLARNRAPEYLQGAVIALDNETGGILVLVGGRDFEHNQYDRALQAQASGRARR